MIRLVLTLLLLPFSAQASGMLDKGFTAKYDVSIKSMYIGVATRQLTVKNSQLIFTSIAEPKGLAKLFISDTVSETSVMEYSEDTIHSINYRYQQTGGKEEINDNVSFNKESNLIKLTHDNQQFPVSENDYDVLNFQLALMLELQKHHNKFTFNVANHRGFYTYHVNVEGKETIHTPAGQFEVVKVNSIHSETGRQFMLWCAPKLDYLPVKLEYIKKKGGDVSKLELKSITM
ncbi:MAG: DUF3108 domain-containing protein [Gammaproteobacteria bacterium]|nr:DUF3108 domain-containing protein [Gammaproteobacteria bacterium]